MPRAPNAVDFWRGFALITIFIDHIPGLLYSRYTLINFSIADAADLFVFLAGWSIRLMADSGRQHMATRDIMMRLFARALELYAAQVLITMLAIAVLAFTAIELANPLLLQWHNAAAIFDDPVPTHIGLAVLTHQLGYFDILPLYVVLMLMAPFFALIDRTAPAWTLPVSLALYVVVLAFRLTLPTWPVAGTWFFNPLAWQVLLVLGFTMARPDDGIGALARRHIRTLRIVAVPIVILGVLVAVFDWWPDPTNMPEPKLFFIADKTYVTPIRLIQFLSLVAVFSLAFPTIRKAADLPYIGAAIGRLIGMLAMLGRNSLYVFCVGSLLSLMGQIFRFYYRGSVTIDTAVVILGIIIMAFTAWLAEIRERWRPAPAAAASRQA
ncbi:MAG: OpgC domain-containing protein [Proteobacteria bacterium]|nr:OpgC domain-containing protein [Pseudomonadota bacterium]